MTASPGLPTFLRDDHPLEWLMTPPERAAMVQLLDRIKPPVAVEVGTHRGGSLQILAGRSGRVYSIDINPEVARSLKGYFKNVTFCTGDSGKLLPNILKEVQASGEELGFVLIDGDHTAQGVMTDVNLVLKHVPKRPVYIVLHDSFNPGCRQGMLAAGWAQCPYVHYFNVDFVGGIFFTEKGNAKPSMWGGLGLAVMLPEKRKGELKILQPYSGTFECVYPNSCHYTPSQPEAPPVAPAPPPPTLGDYLKGLAREARTHPIRLIGRAMRKALRGGRHKAAR